MAPLSDQRGFGLDPKLGSWLPLKSIILSFLSAAEFGPPTSEVTGTTEERATICDSTIPPAFGGTPAPKLKMAA